MAPTEVYVPVPPDTDRAGQSTVRSSLRGKSVAVVNNGWGSMDDLAGYIETELRERYGVSKVLHYRNNEKAVFPQPSWFDDIAADVAGAVTGLGN
jgi:hypothetical protein